MIPPEKLGRRPGRKPCPSQPRSETQRACSGGSEPQTSPGLLITDGFPQASFLAAGNGQQHSVLCQSELYNWGVLSKMTKAMSKYSAPGSGPFMNLCLMTPKAKKDDRTAERWKDPRMWHGV